MVFRQISELLKKRYSGQKLIVLTGSRSTGKSTLLQEIEANFKTPICRWQGNDEEVNTLLQGLTTTRIRQLVGSANTLIIEEAQRIDNINHCLRQINDTVKSLKIIACCATSISESNEVDNPLNGRKIDIQLFPLSFGEMVAHHGLIDESKLLNQRLVYGYYPEIVQNPDSAKSTLKQLINQILYRDVLTAERILKPEKLDKLLQAIAWQVGNEISYNELGKHCGLDNQTVEKYVAQFEKAFILFRLPSLSKNLAGEHRKSRKIYFYDNGIRNALINQFNPIDSRNDTDALWENFLISERLKLNSYQGDDCSRHFWRTNANQQVDYIEERNERLSAYMFKWEPSAKVRFAKNFRDTYQPTEMNVITRANYFSFLGLE